MMFVIVYYVSSHGFGHLSRSIHVMETLLHRKVADKIIIRSKLPRHVFKQMVPPILIETSQIILSEPSYELDAGVVQCSPLDVDIESSLRRHIELMENLSTNSSIIQNEIDFLCQIGEYSSVNSDESEKIIAVLSDVSAVSITAANQVNIPSFVISNFDWTAILQDFVNYIERQSSYVSSSKMKHQIMSGDELSSFLNSSKNAIQKMSLMYSGATAIFQPRGIVPSPVRYKHIITTPWITPSILSSADMNLEWKKYRHRLEDTLFGVDRDTSLSYYIVTVTFGGHNSNKKTLSNTSSPIDFSTINASPMESEKDMIGFIFATQDAKDQMKLHKQYSKYPAITASEAHDTMVIPDQLSLHLSPTNRIQKGSVGPLIKVSDVCLCKPGYGTISETVASGVTIVYIHREPTFIEERYLIQELGDAAIEMSRNDFENRQMWIPSIKKALSSSAKSAAKRNQTDRVSVCSMMLNEDGENYTVVEDNGGAGTNGIDLDPLCGADYIASRIGEYVCSMK